MRTKALLCAAAMAAGAAISMAQGNVYSLNIVGYANVPNPNGYSFQTTPFQVTTAVTNGANEILPANTGQYDGDQLLLWTGTSWNSYYLFSTSPTGFADSGGTPIGAPILTPGLGYLYYNAQGTSNNITYIGQVRTGTNTVNIPATPEFSAVGSTLPLAGGLTSVLQFTNNAGALDGDDIQVPATDASGNITSFKASYFFSGSATGFADSGGTTIPEPQIAVGQGFFFDNIASTPVTWKQVLNP